MDDLTRIAGIGKATAKKLEAAGFGTFAALAAATDANALIKLQDAGFATVDIDKWVAAAATLSSEPAASTDTPRATTAEPSGGGDPAAPAESVFVALQEIQIGSKKLQPGDEVPPGLTPDELRRLVELRAVVGRS